MCCILTVFKITVNLGALTYRAVCHRPDLSCLWKLMGDSCTIIHPLPTKNFRSVASVIKWCWFQKYMYCIYAQYYHTVCSVQVKIIECVKQQSLYSFAVLQCLKICTGPKTQNTAVNSTYNKLFSLEQGRKLKKEFLLMCSVKLYMSFKDGNQIENQACSFSLV